jgi:hypothetical protein
MIYTCRATLLNGKQQCMSRGQPYFNAIVNDDVCTQCKLGADMIAYRLLHISNPAADLLPPFQEGRDRPVTIDDDGTILYSEDIHFPDPPLDINGYLRDPRNPLRFISQWPKCAFRTAFVVRYAKCGCLDVLMRCSHTGSPLFQDRVDTSTCTKCPLR